MAAAVAVVVDLVVEAELPFAHWDFAVAAAVVVAEDSSSSSDAVGRGCIFDAVALD